MELKVQLPFQQLLAIVKSLTPGQRAKLRAELDEEKKLETKSDDLIEYLMNGPVYSKNDIQVVEKNRKSIAEWRTKS